MWGGNAFPCAIRSIPSRQGLADRVLAWLGFVARPAAPDYGSCSAARDDRGGGRATLPVASKLAATRAVRVRLLDGWRPAVPWAHTRAVR
jgi:hypothetical protein